jgi:hypothetical protein
MFVYLFNMLWAANRLVLAAYGRGIEDLGYSFTEILPADKKALLWANWPVCL